MKMSLRWFGEGHDSVTLEQIRQIPGVGGVITTLYDTAPGDEWALEDIQKMKKGVEASGLKIYGMESVNVSDEIKVGHAKRDEHIENYIATLKKLSDEGINMVCYNFMPVFDWTRSELAKVRPDGSTVLAYNQEKVDAIHPQEIFDHIDNDSNGFVMPGWEPERMGKVEELFHLYEDTDNEKLFQNLKYFLEAIMPTCEQYGVKMAIHIDDPVWSVYGLPRIVKNKMDLQRLVTEVPSEYNGVTLCTGSLSSKPDNDIPDIIRSLKGRIHFAHVRNTKHTAPGIFEESAHLSSDGSLDMYEIMKAFDEIGFDGPVRPDHGRAIWGEVSMPGYGLYDRALGSQYLLGLIEAIKKTK
ncbi:MAG: mannonate dehydratase [Spirochaetales bacterium]|nr:mannonate dehydratase [Spirochaetales bacterium]